MNKILIVFVMVSVFLVSLSLYDVKATHGGQYHIIESATKHKANDMITFSINATENIPNQNIIFDPEHKIFGYAWLDISQLSGIAAVIHPDYVHFATDPPSWHMHPLTLDSTFGYEDDPHHPAGQAPLYCLTSIESIHGGTVSIQDNILEATIPAQEFPVVLGDIDFAVALEIKSSLACESGLVATTFSTVATSTPDGYASCAGLQGEELLICRGDTEAFDAGGRCEGLTSLECLERSVDNDGDGVGNEVDQCPDTAETINGIEDEDGCPENLHTYTSDEVKDAYGGLTVKFEDKIPQAILDEFGDIPKPQPVEDVKLDTRIFEIQTIDEPEDYARQTGIDFKENLVKVLVFTKGNDVEAKINEIASIQSSYDNLYQVEVEIGKIEELSQLSEVLSINTLQHAIQTAYISEGVESIKADIITKGGLTGKDVKIAIFDLAFDVTNSEINNKIKESKSFRHDFKNSIVPVGGLYGEHVHGTAVAEIITDVAPDSELFLYTFESEIEFLDAVSYAQEQNVDMMAMSAGWISYPTDGTSIMTKKIEDVINQGTPFVVSAGNYAQTHWEGNYLDDDSDGWHEFDSEDEGLSFEVTESRVIQGAPIVAYLMWENTDNKSHDFDITLKDSSDRVIATSSNVQSSAQSNFEYVYFAPEKSGTYSIGVSYSGTSSPSAKLEIFSQSDILEYSVSEGSVSVPTDARGIIAVGAIHHSKNVLEPFSSQGPTNQGRTPVPHIVAPDGVSTLAYGNSPFYGTSAAAPHVAGLVALVIDSNSKLTPGEIAQLLQSNTDTTITLIQSGFDNYFGYGKVDATFLSEVANQSPEIPSWIKNTAGWWSDGQIGDSDFVKGVEFLIKEGIISVPPIEGESQTVVSSDEVYQLPKYKQITSIDVSGVIDNYRRGTPVDILIIKPNGEEHELSILASKDGSYGTTFDVPHDAQIGKYTLFINYDGKTIDSRTISIVEDLESIPQPKIDIPPWIKNNAGWWSKDQIGDSDFVSGIQFLIKNGIMNIR